MRIRAYQNNTEYTLLFSCGLLPGSSYIAIEFAPEVIVHIALRAVELPRGVFL